MLQPGAIISINHVPNTATLEQEDEDGEEDGDECYYVRAFAVNKRSVRWMLKAAVAQYPVALLVSGSAACDAQGHTLNGYYCRVQHPRWLRRQLADKRMMGKPDATFDHPHFGGRTHDDWPLFFHKDRPDVWLWATVDVEWVFGPKQSVEDGIGSDDGETDTI